MQSNRNYKQQRDDHVVLNGGGVKRTIADSLVHSFTRECSMTPLEVNCDDCCEEDLCNANFSVQYYQEMMSRQYTSWFTPLPGEQERKNPNRASKQLRYRVQHESAEVEYRGISCVVNVWNRIPVDHSMRTFG
ncbi:unnamed protein product [Haemonchus placei]|uniref:Astrotactin-2 n=1 Tax=Haemonchus placei TaxID=6290 RepID=A0A158QPV3_HAEPC|nr:unnamed protein product [Haemonchus placei]